MGMTLAINVGYDGSWKDTISNQMDEFCEIYLRASGTSSWRAFPSPGNNDDAMGGQSTESKLFPFDKSAWAGPWEAQTEQARSLLITIEASVNRNRTKNRQGLETSKISAYNIPEAGVSIPKLQGERPERVVLLDTFDE